MALLKSEPKCQKVTGFGQVKILQSFFEIIVGLIPEFTLNQLSNLDAAYRLGLRRMAALGRD
jgi:hypothetical protein